MRIHGIGGELQIALLHRTPSQSIGEPDLHIRCHAKTSLFSVEGSSAWLEWPDVRAFVAELEAFNRSLVGKAELTAMSPSDFTLTITNIDSKGHVGVSFAIGARNITDNGQFESSVNGGFEVLPGEVDQLLAWFQSVIANESAA